MEYFKNLNVNKHSSKKEINDAYKQLAKEHHPDKSNGDDSVFVSVKNAFDKLMKSFRNVFIPSVSNESNGFQAADSQNYSTFQATEDSSKIFVKPKNNASKRVVKRDFNNDSMEESVRDFKMDYAETAKALGDEIHVRKDIVVVNSDPIEEGIKDEPIPKNQFDTMLNNLIEEHQKAIVVFNKDPMEKTIKERVMNPETFDKQYERVKKVYETNQTKHEKQIESFKSQTS
jgi:curved DNA-binding protein CbpA